MNETGGLKQIKEDLHIIKNKVSIFGKGLMFQINEAGQELINEINADLTAIRDKITEYDSELYRNNEQISSLIKKIRGQSW